MADANPTPDTDKQVSPLTALFQGVMEKREKEMLGEIERQIALLNEPDRSTVERISDDKPEPGPIVSRSQPTDPLYRQLHARQPALKEWRTPDLDHWNIKWLRSFIACDHAGMKLARVKSHEAAGIRATTLGGVLDASDPTAITDGTGGHLLPQPMSNVVEIARQSAAVMASLVTNFTTNASTLRVPTAGAVTAVTAAEGAAPAQAEPTFASEMLILHKIGARMIASIEMLADSSFNLMSIYAMRAGEGIGAKEDEQICATDGSSPNLTEAIAGGNVDEATTTVLIYEDLVTLYFALGKAYRGNAVWLGSAATLTLLSTLMDGNDHPILKIATQQPNVVTDVPGALGSVFGKPVYEVPLADGTLLFGDVRGYGFVRGGGGIVASMSTDVGFASDTVQFKFTERADGRIIDDVAMKQMAALATVA